MEIYSPYTITTKESKEYAEEFDELIRQIDVPDDALIEYFKIYHRQYRDVLERYFPDVAPYLPFYEHYPYKTVLVRLGPNGVISCHKPNIELSVEVMRPDDFNPPLISMNVFEVAKTLESPIFSFNFYPKKYESSEAELEATQSALKDALGYFWTTINKDKLSELCFEILKAENIDIEVELEQPEDHIGFDYLGKVLFQEPAGFRRFENWGFEIKHYRQERISARYLRKIEEQLLKFPDFPDVVCLITSGDLTSIGNNITVNNNRIRVWDRAVLNSLIHKHLSLLESYFYDYSSALKSVSKEFKEAQLLTESQYDNLTEKLRSCPPGREHFDQFEEIGIEIWEYLFPKELGKAKKQGRTSDGTQRRDVLFRNNRISPFFQRVAQKFDADFIIIDYKNYTDPVDPDTINSVTKYANKAIGRLIIVASRKGAEKTVEAHQIRIFRDDDILVLVVSDQQMLEMITRKENGENPEDLIEDMLDDILIKY